jgi:hypothetical protein
LGTGSPPGPSLNRNSTMAMMCVLSSAKSSNGFT